MVGVSKPTICPVFAALHRKTIMGASIFDSMDNESLLRQVAEVRCSKCGADIGPPCRLPSGGVRYTPHKSRKMVALGGAETQDKSKSCRSSVAHEHPEVYLGLLGARPEILSADWYDEKTTKRNCCFLNYEAWTSMLSVPILARTITSFVRAVAFDAARHSWHRQKLLQFPSQPPLAEKHPCSARVLNRGQLETE
jgi:hypothetical protein